MTASPTSSPTPSPRTGARRTTRRGAGALAVLAAGLLALLGAPPAAVAQSAAPAQPHSSIRAVDTTGEAGTDGRCTDASGVTVVVDFQELGQGIVVRCAGWPLPGNGTGLDALKAADIPLTGVARWGEAFICRLYDRPSASEQVAVKNQPDYREACIDTPPAAAYWSYWHSPNGGSWTYSQFGVTNRKAPEGSYEGWSFSLNRTASSNPVPRIAPRHAVSARQRAEVARRASASPTAQAAPRGSDPLAPQPGSGLPGDPAAGDGSGGATSGGPGSGAAAGSGDGSTPSSTAAGSSGAAGTGSSPGAGTSEPPGSSGAGSSGSVSEAPTTSRSSGAASSSGPSRSAGGRATGEDRQDLVVDSDRLAADRAAEAEQGPSVPVLAGLGAVAFLAVMAAGTMLRRRGER